MSDASTEQAPASKRIRLDTEALNGRNSQDSSRGNGIHLDTASSGSFKRLTEQDCGISVFLNDHITRFKCLLKELTSDFQVFEVLTTGEVLKLKSVPKEEDLQRNRDEAKAERQEKETIIESQQFDYESEAALLLRELVGDEVFDKIKDLFQCPGDWQGLGANAPLPVITPVMDDREKRTRIHKAIRDVFLGSLNSEARDDKKMKISLKLKQQHGRSGSKGGRGRGRGGRERGDGGDRREAWTEKGDYTLFTVYKDGRDTMDVANNLAKILRVPTKVFGYSGTKDKRGCTVQLFSAYRTQIQKIAGLNKNGALKNVVLGDFHYGQKSLTLGDLRGNKFVLVLRNIQGSTDDEINESFRLINERGFVNYYGLQRFGSSATGTHQVGVHVLQGNYEKACRLILEEHSGAWRETKDAKLHWLETGDAEATLSMMPSKCVAEVAILKHLAKQDQMRDWAGAFGSIPRNLRLMYMHAYQSLVWNNVTSKRLAEFGMKPVAGDLILSDSPDAFDSDTKADDAQKPVARARAITVEEVENYSIHDVVLPLPGCDIVYPENKIRDFYSEYMQREALDPFSMVRNTKETSLLGSYRKVLSRPIDLQWQILKYADNQKDQQLVATNLDELENRVIDLPQEGNNTAVRLEFQLESAAYATMLLREALSSVPFSI